MFTFVNFYTERWKQMPISLKQALCTQFKVGRPRLVSGTWSSTIFSILSPFSAIGTANRLSKLLQIVLLTRHTSCEKHQLPIWRVHRSRFHRRVITSPVSHFVSYSYLYFCMQRHKRVGVDTIRRWGVVIYLKLTFIPRRSKAQFSFFSSYSYAIS